MKRLLTILLAITTLASLVAGCALPEQDAQSNPTAQAPQTGSGLTAGTLEIRVTDAPRQDNVSEIWVTVTDVQIHKAGAASNNETENDGDWITANITGPNPFELLALKNSNGIQQMLAGANLVAGNYTQIRFNVSKVEAKIDGVLQDAKMPSEKLKFNQPFEISAGQTTVLVFDFDADKIVNVTGNGKIIVKPVVKMTTRKPGNNGSQTPTPTPSSLKITTPNLPSGADNVSYAATIVAEGGTAPYAWSLTAGSLPVGLSVNGASGVISGTPQGSGDFTFTIGVTDNSTPTKNASRQYTITIAAITITTTGLPDAMRNAAYSVTMNAVGGTPPYSWTIAPNSGVLPPGLSLIAPTGMISGNATSNGNFTFTIQVSDNSTPNKVDTQELTLRVREN